MDVARKSTDRPSKEAGSPGKAKPQFSTRIGTGAATLSGVDARTREGRRHREIVRTLTVELGPDLNELDRLSILNAAAWVIHAEDLTAKMARGEAVAPEALTRAANGAQRTLNRLRRTRVVRKAGPKGRAALDAYLSSRGEG